MRYGVKVWTLCWVVTTIKPLIRKILNYDSIVLMHTTRKKFLTTISSFGVLAALTLTACGSGAASNTATSDSASASTSASAAPIVEGKGPASRIAITYDGGVLIYDAKDMKLIQDIKKDGFLRLNSAGDNRHLVVSDGNSYTFLDTGVWAVPHGDHSHYYTTEPSMSSLSLTADHTGHVITDNNKTAAFADGTGTFDVYSPADLTVNQRTASSLNTEQVKLPSPHHGFAIPLENNRYLVSVGDDKTRTGAAVVDAQGKTITENKECPGVHGEAIAKDNIITIGCTDGALIYKEGTFTKITNPEDPYSRSGNQVGSPDSQYVLVDYKTDKDAKLERPEKFAVIDTVAKKRNVYTLPKGVSYTFRSFGRGPQGEVLLLTTDGKLRIIDPATGKELGTVQLMDSWSESETWQDPRPALWVDGKTAYVTDPATKKLHAVNISDAKAPKTLMSIELPQTPNEIKGSSSSKPAQTDEHGHDDASASSGESSHAH